MEPLLRKLFKTRPQLIFPKFIRPEGGHQSSCRRRSISPTRTSSAQSPLFNNSTFVHGSGSVLSPVGASSVPYTYSPFVHGSRSVCSTLDGAAALPYTGYTGFPFFQMPGSMFATPPVAVDHKVCSEILKETNAISDRSVSKIANLITPEDMHTLVSFGTAKRRMEFVKQLEGIFYFLREGIVSYNSKYDF